MNTEMQVPPQAASLIRIYGMEDAGHEPKLPAAIFKRSHTMAEIHWNDNPAKSAPDFEQERDFNNGYRAVWVNHAERAIFTYCEGDLDLTIDPDDATFKKRWAACVAFYEGLG